MKKSITTVAMASLLASTLASAGGLDKIKMQDKYWGASIGNSESDNIGPENISDEDNAFKIYGGARLGDKLGVEIGYTDLGEFKETSGRNPESVEASGFYVAATFTFSTSDKFDFFGKAGLMRWSVDNSDGTDDDGFDPMFGIGAAYKFKKNMDIVADYTMYDVNDADVDVFSIGIKMQLK